MRTILISLAAAASALAVAAPAAAQYYPAPPAYGSPYAAPYGNAYGYRNNYGMVRSFQARIDQIQRLITNLDRRRILTNREARDLRNESRAVERRLRETARNGLSSREAQAVQVRIARLEQKLHRDANDGRGLRAVPYGGTPYDRDRDGRDDRYEDDRGRYPG